MVDRLRSDTGEVDEGDREPSRFGDHQQDAVTGGEATPVERLLEHDEDGGGAGVALGAEVGEPTLLGDHQTRLAHQPHDVGAEILRAVVDQEMIDLVGDDAPVPDQADVLLDPEGDDVAQDRGVLAQVEHAGEMGIGRCRLVLPGGAGFHGVGGGRTGVHAHREAVGV